MKKRDRWWMFGCWITCAIIVVALTWAGLKVVRHFLPPPEPLGDTLALAIPDSLLIPESDFWVTLSIADSAGFASTFVGIRLIQAGDTTEFIPHSFPCVFEVEMRGNAKKGGWSTRRVTGMSLFTE